MIHPVFFCTQLHALPASGSLAIMESKNTARKLFATLEGRIRGKCDFQRPWAVPEKPHSRPLHPALIFICAVACRVQVWLTRHYTGHVQSEQAICNTRKLDMYWIKNQDRKLTACAKIATGIFRASCVLRFVRSHMLCPNLHHSLLYGFETGVSNFLAVLEGWIRNKSCFPWLPAVPTKQLPQSTKISLYFYVPSPTHCSYLAIALLHKRTCETEQAMRHLKISIRFELNFESLLPVTK